MKRLMICVAALAMSGSAVAQDVTLKINPGLWENDSEISLEMNMGGQTMTIPVQVTTDQECVTEAETKLDLSDFAEDGCSVADVVQAGNTVTATLSCNNDGMLLNGTITTTVAGDGNSATTTIAADGSSPMGPVSMSGDFTGTRLGGC